MRFAGLREKQNPILMFKKEKYASKLYQMYQIIELAIHRGRTSFKLNYIFTRSAPNTFKFAIWRVAYCRMSINYKMLSLKGLKKLHFELLSQ